jgi:hypothetical protein
LGMDAFDMRQPVGQHHGIRTAGGGTADFGAQFGKVGKRRAARTGMLRARYG